MEKRKWTIRDGMGRRGVKQSCYWTHRLEGDDGRILDVSFNNGR